jgi:Na+/H+ antiporter NhaD/arsenite permease-like protein
MISLGWSIPFALLLGCTALLPLLAKHFWEKFYWTVALGLGVIPLAYYLIMVRDLHPWLHEMQEYVSFIALLGSLYIVSGGIYLGIKARGTPIANATLLIIGAIIANIFGTTGASMLLIRPYLRMNAGRIRPYQIVFFIFIVANVGGALTPIGDPPLFLGYLQGVPFWWVLEHCQPMWWVTVAALIVVFLGFELVDVKKHPRVDAAGEQDATTRILGAHNFVFIAMILYGVFQTGIFQIIEEANDHGFSLWTLLHALHSREVLMIGATVLSKVFTRAEPYHRNEFSYAAIKEVAILFIGIFSTMTPALQYLKENSQTSPLMRALHTPGQFYYSTGTLSAVLDNAPTYLTFLNMELAKIDPEHLKLAREAVNRMGDEQSLSVPADLPPVVRGALTAMVEYHPKDILNRKVHDNELRVSFLVGNVSQNLLLVAVSLGAVFFGACTYIGNGPNFMVKNIADSHGVATPGFIGYVMKYALPILVPTFTLVWWLFLR